MCFVLWTNGGGIFHSCVSHKHSATPPPPISPFRWYNTIERTDRPSPTHHPNLPTFATHHTRWTTTSSQSLSPSSGYVVLLPNGGRHFTWIRQRLERPVLSQPLLPPSGRPRRHWRRWSTYRAVAAQTFGQTSDVDIRQRRCGLGQFESRTLWRCGDRHRRDTSAKDGDDIRMTFSVAGWRVSKKSCFFFVGLKRIVDWRIIVSRFYINLKEY